VLQKKIKHQEADVEHMVSRSAQGRALDKEALDDSDIAKRDDLNAQMRQSLDPESRARKIGTANIEKNVKHETSAIASEASRTTEGQRLDIQAVADEDIAKTDRSVATSSYLNDDDYADVRTAADTATTKEKNDQAERQVLVDAASEGPVQIGKDADGKPIMVDQGRIRAKAAGFTDAQIDELQAQKHRQMGLSRQSANYERETKKNYQRSIAQTVYAAGGLDTWLGEYEADGVTPKKSTTLSAVTIPAGEEYVHHYDSAGNPVMATVLDTDTWTDDEGNVKPGVRGQRIFPITDAAIEAAQGDPNGIIRLQAQAEYEGDQQEREAVDQRKIRMSSDLQPDELADVAYQELLRAEQNDDVEGALAAQELLDRTGEKGHNLLINYWLSQKPAQMRTNLNRKLKNNLLGLGIKEKNLALDKLAIDKGGQRTLAEIMLTPPIDEKTGEYIPGQDLFKGLKGRQLLNQAMPMMYALYRTGTIDINTAQALLDNPSLQDEMTPEKRAFLQTIATGNGAALDSDKQFENLVIPGVADGGRKPMPPIRSSPTSAATAAQADPGPVIYGPDGNPLPPSGA
jgi:hypothetical protein